MRLLAIVCSSLTLVACGGGGGGGGANTVAVTPPASVNQTAALSGTATVGTPLSGAKIILLDVNGKSLETTANETGGYAFSDVSSLTAPILVIAKGNSAGQAVTYASVVTQSVLGGALTVNVSPLTDAILTQAIGESPAYVINDTTLIKDIDAAMVNSSSQKVAAAVKNVLDAIHPGSSTGYSAITTPFVADGVNSYDKIFDMISVSVTTGPTSIDIGLTDKSGVNGTVMVTSANGGNAASMAAPPSSFATLPTSKIKDTLDAFNSLVSTDAGLQSAGYAALYSDGYLDNGKTKDQKIAIYRDSNNSAYQLGWNFSNPIVRSCDLNYTCTVGFTLKKPVGGGEKEATFKYNVGQQKWLFNGNQNPDLVVNFVPYGLMHSGTQILTGANVNIFDSNKLYPYNSAVVTFEDKDGNVDASLNFANKAACPTNMPSYYGLPLDSVGDPSNSTFCGNWFNGEQIPWFDAANKKILAGGYRIRTKVYLSFDRTGPVAAEVIKPINTPLLTTSELSKNDFPAVSIGDDADGPYLKIANASDFNLNGSVCMSSAVDPGYCDMVNYPPHTTNIKGSGVQLESIYRPLPTDGWSATDIVRSFFVQGKDKYGRDLRSGS